MFKFSSTTNINNVGWRRTNSCASTSDLAIPFHLAATVACALDAWGPAALDLASGDMERCQEVAGIAARLCAEAIRWSSATGAGQSLAVFVDQLRPDSHAEILRSFDLTRDALSAIEAGTSIMTLIPGVRVIALSE